MPCIPHISKNTETKRPFSTWAMQISWCMHVIALNCNMRSEIPLISVCTPLCNVAPAPPILMGVLFLQPWSWAGFDGYSAAEAVLCYFQTRSPEAQHLLLLPLEPWDLLPERKHDLGPLKIKHCSRRRLSCPSRAYPQPTLQVNTATWVSKTSWRSMQPIHRYARSNKSLFFETPELYLLVFVWGRGWHWCSNTSLS